ncbi:hypothetical protein YC2023_082620 [Brassica napus]
MREQRDKKRQNEINKPHRGAILERYENEHRNARCRTIQVIYKSPEPEVKRILHMSYQIPKENVMLIPSSLLQGELLELKIWINELSEVE